MNPEWLHTLANTLQRPTTDPLVQQLAALLVQVQAGTLSTEQANQKLRHQASTNGDPLLSFVGAHIDGNLTLRDVAGRDIITITVVQMPPPPPRAAPFFAPYPQPAPGTLVGRSELLTDVRGRLCRAETVRLALQGMPGVGKTRLATELAYDAQLRTHFSGGVFMTSFGQRPDLEDRLNRWARALGIDLHPRLNLSERVELFAATLTRAGQPCLLIIDDVWTTEDTSALLFGSPVASFLFTSRQRDQLTKPVDYDRLLGADNLIAVSPLDTSDAAKLLQQQAGFGTATHRTELEALAKLVGGLPLLLNAMGGRLAEVRQQEQWFAQVLEELQQASTRLNLPVRAIEQTRANMRGGWFAGLRRKPIEKTLNASAVIDLSIARLPHNAKELLIRLAALPSDPLSFGLDAACEVWEHANDQTLQLLAQRHLLIETQDGRFRMHHVLWDWAESKHYNAVNSARRHLADWHALLPTADYSETFLAWSKHPDNWQQLIQTWQNAIDDPEALRNCIGTIVPLLIQHAYWNTVLDGLKHALQVFKRVDRELTAWINRYLSEIYYRRAEYQQAHGYALDALHGYQDSRSPDGQAVAYALLGLIEKDLGNYVPARAAFEAALGLTQVEDESNYATNLSNLAGLLRDQDEHGAARLLYEHALQIREQALGPIHPDTATSLNNLAELLSDQGEYVAARLLYERTLRIHEQVLEPTHPNTASAMGNLAGLLRNQGEYVAARSLYERALEIHEQVLGPNHPNTATSLNNLAGLLHDEGKYVAARPLFERVLQIHEQVLGSTHSDTASSLNNLAGLLTNQGEYVAARLLFERALQIHEQVLGPTHPDTASTLGNLAGLFREQGEYVAARPLFERALQIREHVLGPTHPNTASSLNNLAVLLRKQGEYVAARLLFERALQIREQKLGPTHPDTATSLNSLAVLLRKQGEYVAARPLFERALQIREHVLGPTHPDTASSLNNLAGLLRNQGEYEAAHPLYERALQIREQVLGPTHPDTASSLSSLAKQLEAQDGYVAARPLFERALQIREQVLGPIHPDTQKVRGTLHSMEQRAASSEANPDDSPDKE